MLDLRERDEFELFHIKESLNFPAPNIGRDKFSAEMFAFVKYLIDFFPLLNGLFLSRKTSLVKLSFSTLLTNEVKSPMRLFFGKKAMRTSIF